MILSIWNQLLYVLYKQKFYHYTSDSFNKNFVFFHLKGDPPKTMFPIEDQSIYAQAEQLAKEAQSSRQFTDVDKFSLKCNQCDILLKGQVQAQQHAKSTGHTNFGEV